HRRTSAQDNELARLEPSGKTVQFHEPRRQTCATILGATPQHRPGIGQRVRDTNGNVYALGFRLPKPKASVALPPTQQASRRPARLTFTTRRLAAGLSPFRCATSVSPAEDIPESVRSSFNLLQHTQARIDALRPSSTLLRQPVAQQPRCRRQAYSRELAQSTIELPVLLYQEVTDFKAPLRTGNRLRVR